MSRQRVRSTLCAFVVASIAFGCSGSDDAATDAVTGAAQMQTTVWVLQGNDLLAIGPDGKVAEPIPVGGQAIDALDNDVWVATSTGALVHVDAATKKVADPIDLGGKTVNSSSVSVADDGTVWTCDGNNGLHRVEPGATAADDFKFADYQTCAAVYAHKGDVRIATSSVRDGDQIFRIDETTDELVLAFEQPMKADQLARGPGGMLYSACRCDSPLLAVDAEGASEHTITGPVSGIAVVPGALWFAGEGLVVRYDLESGALDKPLLVGEETASLEMADGDGYLYAGKHDLHRIDPFTGRASPVVAADENVNLQVNALAVTVSKVAR